MATHVEKMTFSPFQENTYIVHDGTHCVIIDPGCYEQHERNFLANFIESKGLTPLAILLTHGHLDHIFGVDFVQKKYNVDVYLHEKDLFTYEGSQMAAHLYGLNQYVHPEKPTKLLNGTERLVFGEMEFQVMFTPGHCVGHVVYYNEAEKYVINGDVLFRGSYGRYDLPGGDFYTLQRTIIDTMFALPEETLVYSGHGPETTIRAEKQSNPILFGH